MAIISSKKPKMGYMGMGMQRWISNMKPRKFLAKRSKPDGGGMENEFGHDISNHYHLKPNKLENLLRIRFPSKYRKKLEYDIKTDGRKRLIYNILSLLIALIIVVSLLAYLSKIFGWF